MSSYSILKSLGEESLNKPFLKYNTKGIFSFFCYKDCMRLLSTLSFMFYACFMLNNSVYSVKTIKLVWQGRPQSHAMLALLDPMHWNGEVYWYDITQLIVEPDWCTFISSNMKQCKHRDKADSFIYSDFCTSVRTGMYLRRHMNNTTD